MFKVYGVEDWREHGQNMDQIMRLVSRLAPNEKQFKEYITT